MESDQTGFSGSPPSGVAGVAAVSPGCNDDGTNGEPEISSTQSVENRNQAFYNHCANDIIVKNEPDDDAPTVVVSSSHQAPLPTISDENWRAFYQNNQLVVLNGDVDSNVGTVYETYKLPPLGKIGKGIVGKLPAAFFGVTVAPSEGELITAHTDSSPVPSPVQQPSDLSTPTAIYLHRGDNKVIVHSVDRENSVIQPVPDGVVGDSGKQDDKEPSQALPLLAPTAVEVKQTDDSDNQDVEMVAAAAEVSRQREMQGEGSPNDIPLENTTYPTGEFSPSAYEPLGTGQYSVLTNVVVTVAPPPQYGQTTSASNTYTLTPTDYFREVITEYLPQSTTDQQYVQAVRHLAAYPETAMDNSNTYGTVERYIRQQQAAYKPSPHGLTVDLPSPDSGIGETTVTPRDSLQQIFDYTDIAQSQPILQQTDEDSQTSRGTSVASPSGRKNSWNHEYGRNSELDKVQIPKLYSDVGFHYFLESPISTSQRREDDRMTYINKGQYYGITLEYINDPEQTLRSCTVKSTVMLVFREEKSHEDELKAWKFWHGRQHSVKQRILDADTKNSCGIIGQIEEVTHNAIAFYWNPLEGPAKISVSVHCLSTDFSNQKGVKGFPLHIQVDTTDDLRENAQPIHRGYCQIKVFCDKGAERKTRDEERRAAKRKLTATGGRKKIEEMYHTTCERSEFYSMSDLSKPPILFTPDDDTDKSNGELTFYTIAAAAAAAEENAASAAIAEVKAPVELPVTPPLKKFKLTPPDRELTNVSYWESVLLYVKRQEDEVFFPLHLTPPTLNGLAKAMEAKYNIGVEMIRNFYKKCKKGITVMMDDDMVRLYCNEDTFVIDVIKAENENKYDITFTEL